MRPLIVVAAAVAAVAAVGCGGGGERAQVQSATERFLQAIDRRDGRAACAELTEATRTELESSEQEPCRRAIVALDLRAAAVTRVQVFITDAKADLGNGDSVFLDRGPDGWRMSAIGCAPRGKPVDRPYDCEAQA